MEGQIDFLVEAMVATARPMSEGQLRSFSISIGDEPRVPSLDVLHEVIVRLKADLEEVMIYVENIPLSKDNPIIADMNTIQVIG